MLSSLNQKKALISVSDKQGVVDFAQKLLALNFEILSTGGTAKALKSEGLKITDVSEYTGFQEILDGRVKTLHPKIHAGILARRDNKEDQATLDQLEIGLIDLVVVNLYPFEKTTCQEDASFCEAIEQIDIGGPTLLRAAAKNQSFVAAVVDPADYDEVVFHLQGQNSISSELRLKLAAKVFSHTSYYDALIAGWLAKKSQTSIVFPDQLSLPFRKKQLLRYGENPHQSAAYYIESAPPKDSISAAMPLQGKPLSFNNIADADAAWQAVKSFDQPACVIVKHANPCGVAVGQSLEEAYHKAFSCDKTSAFGGIVACNDKITEKLAQTMSQLFVEVIIAPSFSEEAKHVFGEKTNLRLLQVPLLSDKKVDSPIYYFDYKRVGGGLLIQEQDLSNDSQKWQVVSKREPTEKELKGLVLAWRIAKFVKSNAIVFSNEQMSLAIGAGQMSRIDSVRIASLKADENGHDLKGSVVASDAFFPFRDAVDHISKTGASAIIHPGGSIRDQDSIDAADEYDMAMLLTKRRHFRH